MADAKDSFNRADNTDLGANWDTYTTWNNLQIVGNEVRAGAIGGLETLESWNANAFTDNQFAECTLVTMGGTLNANLGVALRAATPSTLTAYVFVAQLNDLTTRTQIYKQVGGVFTQIAANNVDTWAAGDRLRGQAIGSSLAMFQNGVSRQTATDTDIASGRAGAEVYVTGAVADAEIDDWFAGDIAVLHMMSMLAQALQPPVREKAQAVGYF